MSEDNIKTGLISRVCLFELNLSGSEYTLLAGCCEGGYEPFGLQNGGELMELLSILWLWLVCYCSHPVKSHTSRDAKTKIFREGGSPECSVHANNFSVFTARALAFFSVFTARALAFFSVFLPRELILFSMFLPRALLLFSVF